MDPNSIRLSVAKVSNTVYHMYCIMARMVCCVLYTDCLWNYTSNKDIRAHSILPHSVPHMLALYFLYYSHYSKLAQKIRLANLQGPTNTVGIPEFYILT